MPYRLSTHALVLAVVLAGCEGVVPGPPVAGDAGPPPSSGDGGGGYCTVPGPGCACEAGQGPIDCYTLPALGAGGETICGGGTSYCRAGTWSACESVHTFTLDPTTTALVTGPDPCNPCDPRCFVSRDVPGPADVQTGLQYVAVPGGLTLAGSPMITMPLPDGDGDGVPDVADDCVGAGWYRDPATGTCSSNGFFHLLPQGTSAIDPLPISTQIRTADVYFLMDTTASMDGELARLRTDLTAGTFLTGCTGGIIGAIRCLIPDAWFGVGFHDDYPVSPYGGGVDAVYRNILDIQSSVAAAQTAVNGLTIHFGDDGPESQTQALYSIASGNGLSTYLPARTGCAAGTAGYPCFRPGSIPIGIYVTDAPFHNGPGGANPYCFGCARVPLPAPRAVRNNEDASSAYPAPPVGAAVNITGTWVGFSGSTAGMRDDYWFGCNARGAPDALFRVRLTAPQYTTFTLEGSTYDTVLGVFPVAGGGGWCNDDYGGLGLQSRLDVSLPAGDYWVLVDGYLGAAGNYRLTMGVAPTVTPTYGGVTWPDAVAAINARGMRLIAIQSCGVWSDPYCLEGESHARALANATGSVDGSGNPYVFRINADGTGLSSTIVSAVQSLAQYARMDVTARPSGDTMGFTNTPIAAISWGPRGSCAGIAGGSTFTQCLPSTDVNFRVTFSNTAVAPTTVPQVFNFFIEIIGDGTLVLARIPVRIVVPPAVPIYPASAAYVRDYDSGLRCALNETPAWSTFSWVATLPAGTRIAFQIQSAMTQAALTTAPVVTVTVPTSTSPIDLGTVLATAGVPNGLQWLRVTAVLYADTLRIRAPTLTSTSVTYTCILGL